jgi:hypothetical protein
MIKLYIHNSLIGGQYSRRTLKGDHGQLTCCACPPPNLVRLSGCLPMELTTALWRPSGAVGASVRNATMGCGVPRVPMPTGCCRGWLLRCRPG